MALKLKEEKKSRVAILAVLIIILVSLAIWIFYNSYIAKIDIVTIDSPMEIPLWWDKENFPKLPEIPEIDLEKSVLNSLKFVNLKQIAELPIRPGKLGRSNPFSPFSTTTIINLDIE